MAEAANEYIESMKPAKALESDGEKRKYDVNKIKWEQAEGASGPYECTEDINNTDYKALLQDLAAHKGKLNQDGYFYWTFKKSFTIGRKKKTKKPQ